MSIRYDPYRYYHDYVGPGRFYRNAKWALDYFGELPSSRNQYYAQAVLSGIVAPYGAWYKARDSIQYTDDYLSNRNLQYSDIRYPSRTSGFSDVSYLANAGMNFVSDNVRRLYK